MPRRTSSVLSLLAALAATGLAYALGRRQRPHHPADELWKSAEDGAADIGLGQDQAPVASLRARAQAKADEVAANRRSGSPEDRQGHERPSVGLDVAKLESVASSLEPVVQYLTYIQSRRGQDKSLLFIRYDDIDAMAELDGEPSEELLDRLDQLGVVISAN